MFEGIGVDASGHETGEMRHIHEQFGTDLVGDLTKRFEIDNAWIGRSPGKDHLGLVLARQVTHLVEVDAMSVWPNAIGNDVEPFAGLVDRRAVGEMPAGG